MLTKNGMRTFAEFLILITILYFVFSKAMTGVDSMPLEPVVHAGLTPVVPAAGSDAASAGVTASAAVGSAKVAASVVASAKVTTNVAVQVDITSDALPDKSTGPLYYNTYEYQQAYNSYFPESRMKSTIDWLADNFKASGFEYFTLDGWINTAVKHTANGYITTHADSWKHDLTYWADYAHSRDLKFGFYYPPFWVHKTIVSDSAVKVEGTNIKVADVVDKNKTFEDWYLVDPDKAGAREYMQGFVHYMKMCGIDYIKVDFLMHYENVMGTSKLSKTLEIISDAAHREGILISWSAPNNHKHAAVESLYGDMLRISQDVFRGGWGSFSSNDRGKIKNGWPEWNNAFDALINYSDRTGKNKIILDADFIIAHSFKTDSEAKAAVSLSIMAGAGLGVADIPEKLGDRAWVYKNSEILGLNKEGLIGKPLSKVMDTAGSPNAASQIWFGRVNNGDWIIGLFNREDTASTRSISFKTLGINGKANVRDLWAHKDLGSMSSYTAMVEPHGVTILRISE
jgi:hypothetical protein